MKKASLFSLAVALILPAAACADNRPIEVEELPAQAKSFLEVNFKDAKVSFATVDRELFGGTYEVTFVDGGSVDFDRKGNWKEVECKTGAVPAAIVPEAILSHVSSRHPESHIRTISHDGRDWDVDLNNGLDLKFDRRFRLVEIED
ncbi:MAG: PepSY-like domain-containing protein [Alistipes sp.]|jgi:hypothetical protein|nr:PepSY-like domain-containing protein [Alistipes sp.]